MSLGSASVRRKPSGRAPFAARSDRFTRRALLATERGGVLGKKMHATDNGIGLQHKVAARRRPEERCIIRQAKRAGMGRDGLEEPRDQAILGRPIVVPGHCFTR